MILLTYIAGPYSGSSQWEVHKNVNQAEALAWEVVKLAHQGYDVWPYCPHTESRNWAGTFSQRFWLDHTARVMVEHCKAVVFTPDWMRSPGAVDEHSLAALHLIPRFYSIDTFKAWLDQEGLKRVPYSLAENLAG